MQYNYLNRQKFARVLLCKAIGAKSKREVFCIFIDEMVASDKRYKVLNNNSDKHLFIKKRLQDWLQGLCSTVAIPFEYYEIIKLANEFGLNRDTEKKQSNFLEIYWKIMANELYSMLSIYTSAYVSNHWFINQKRVVLCSIVFLQMVYYL